MQKTNNGFILEKQKRVSFLYDNFDSIAAIMHEDH